MQLVPVPVHGKNLLRPHRKNWSTCPYTLQSHSAVFSHHSYIGFPQSGLLSFWLLLQSAADGIKSLLCKLPQSPSWEWIPHTDTIRLSATPFLVFSDIQQPEADCKYWRVLPAETGKLHFDRFSQPLALPAAMHTISLWHPLSLLSELLPEFHSFRCLPNMPLEYTPVQYSWPRTRDCKFLLRQKDIRHTRF